MKINKPIVILLISSLVAVYHDSVASIRSNAVGSKYDVLIMQMLKDANGGQVMEEKLRQAAVGISGGSRDNASRGIRRSLKELAAALRIREGVAGTWMLAD